MNCSTSKHFTHDAGSEQHCENTWPERSCKRTNSNVYCYTKTGKNSNLNNSNMFSPIVKKNMMSNIFFQALAKKVIEEQVMK